MTMRVVGGKAQHPPADAGTRVVTALLVLGFMVVGAPFLVVFGVFLYLLASAPSTTTHREQHMQRRRPEPPTLEEVSARTGLTIITDGSVFPVRAEHEWTIDGRAPSPEDAQVYLRTLREELAYYPADLLSAAHLQRVVLASGLKHGGISPGGQASPWSHAIYLNVNVAGESEAHRRRSVHHEIYHMVDYVTQVRGRADPEWEQMNAVGFHYGSGGAAAIRDRHMMASSGGAGFVSGYAMTESAEDKAETYAFMVTEPDALEARAAQDSVLRNKMITIRYRLQRVCPSAGEAFWQAARAAHPPE